MARFFSSVIALCAAITFFYHGTPSILLAQEQESLDKIIAVVDEYVVLQSDVFNQLQFMRQQDPTMDITDEEVKDRILNALIDEKLILAKAIKDTIMVTEDEITQRLNFQLDQLVKQVGSEKRIEEIYGITIEEIRRDFRTEISNQLKIEKYKQSKFFDLKVTNREVDKFYQEQQDSLPMVPASVDLYHIVRFVEAQESVKDDTRTLANRVRDSLLDGGDFADFAKRYSSDFGSAEDGGVLGFTEKGMFVKEYEKVAFTLQPGELSKPVETPFGFHLIELIAKRDNAVNTRHILFKIGATADDKQKVMDFLDSLRKEVMDGKEDFEEIAKQYSEEEETRSFGGYLQRRPMEQLLDMTDVVNGLKDGEVSKARPYTKDPTKTAFHIIYRKKTYEPHVMSLEQDYKNIEQAALFFKRNEQYKKWLQELRQEIYWEIKKD